MRHSGGRKFPELMSATTTAAPSRASTYAVWALMPEAAPVTTACIRTVAAALAAGRIRIPVGAVVPLSRLDEAFALLRDRAVIGKVVLDVRS